MCKFKLNLRKGDYYLYCASNRFTIVMICSLFFACGKPKGTGLLKVEITKAIKNDNIIDEREWQHLSDVITGNPTSFPDYIDNKGNLIPESLKELIVSVAQKRRNGEIPEIHIKGTKKAPKAVIKIYLENSGSMDGYLLFSSDFKASLADYLAGLKFYNEEHLSVNFINSKIFPTSIHDPQQFVDVLEPGKSPYNIGNKSVSKLNEILGLVLDSLHQGEVAIFISDCIYSLEPSKDTEGALEYQKSLTKNVFLDKSKSFKFAAQINKLHSKFSGKYWKKDNTFEILKGADRPYFIWLIGEDNLIKQLSQNVPISKLKGYENSFYLSGHPQQELSNYALLRQTNNIGNFKITREKDKTLTGIEVIRYNNGILQFAIATDLSNIPVDPSYLLDKSHYQVTEGFQITKIEIIDKKNIAPNDYIKIKNTPFTHIITLSTKEKSGIQDAQLSLKDEIPEWVYNSSTGDDTNILNETGKTFGLNYLIEGVYEAYEVQQQGNNNLFNLTVNIKK